MRPTSRVNRLRRCSRRGQASHLPSWSQWELPDHTSATAQSGKCKRAIELLCKMESQHSSERCQRKQEKEAGGNGAGSNLSPRTHRHEQRHQSRGLRQFQYQGQRGAHDPLPSPLTSTPRPARRREHQRAATVPHWQSFRRKSCLADLSGQSRIFRDQRRKPQVRASRSMNSNGVSQIFSPPLASITRHGVAHHRRRRFTKGRQANRKLAAEGEIPLHHPVVARTAGLNSGRLPQPAATDLSRRMFAAIHSA